MTCTNADHYDAQDGAVAVKDALTLDPRLHVGDGTACSGRKWRTIVVDPPWPFADGLRHFLYRADREGRTRGAASNYVLMTMGDIAAIPVGEWAEDENAHLYVWTTNTFMREALDLCDAWGFGQKTILTWIKPRLGMGHYYRNCTEHVVFGARPRSPLRLKSLRTYFHGEQGRHSEKPQTFYDMVESASPGPYLDVFARKQRMGWDVAGNEVYSAIPELAYKPPQPQGTENPRTNA